MPSNKLGDIFIIVMLLFSLGLGVDDIEVFEINEAFASQVRNYSLFRPSKCHVSPSHKTLT